MRKVVRTNMNVYINEIVDLMGFIWRRRGGREVPRKRMKRKRGALKILDEINYYMIIGVEYDYSGFRLI